MEVRLIKRAITAGAMLLLAGCAAAPPWQPPATHPVIAVASVLNPYSALYVSGQDSYDDDPRPAKISFDVNRQMQDTMHADLAGTGLYRIMDMDVDPGTFAVAEVTQRPPSILHPRGPISLDSDLADPLVEQAQKLGADFVVVAVDIRYRHAECYGAVGCSLALAAAIASPEAGWGLHFPTRTQCGRDTSVYLDYYLFVIDVDSGDTVASFEAISDRYIAGIDIDHQDLGTLSDAQKAEIDTDLADMLQKSMDTSLRKVALLPGSTTAMAPTLPPCAAPPATTTPATTGIVPR